MQVLNLNLDSFQVVRRLVSIDFIACCYSIGSRRFAHEIVRQHAFLMVLDEARNKSRTVLTGRDFRSRLSNSGNRG